MTGIHFNQHFCPVPKLKDGVFGMKGKGCSRWSQTQHWWSQQQICTGRCKCVCATVFVLILKYCPPPTDSLPSLSFQIAICLSDFINFLHPSVSRPLFSSLFSQLATSPALKILLVLLYTFICVLCSFWQWLSAVWPRPPTNGRTHTHAHTKMGLCNCRVSTPVLQSSADILLCRFTLKIPLWPRSQHSHPHLAAPTH